MLRRRLLKDSGVDWSKEYLTFIPTVDATTFNYNNNEYSLGTLDYSLDNGDTWTTLARNARTPSVPVRQKIMWRGARSKFGSSWYRSFNASNYFSVCGNPLSTILSDQFIGVDDLTGKDYCFTGLFYNNKYIVDASNLYLGFTTLANSCCSNMFYYCSSLTTAPALPATTLTESCYRYMFQNCKSLTTAPKLPAKTLANSCYSSMFYGCTSLTTAPELPATTLANYCYCYMFDSCTSLTTAPELPATTLTNSCYSSMFYSCSSLTTAPSTLPATTLVGSCYSGMFSGCTSLTTAPELPAKTLANYCYHYMFNDCSNLNYIKAMFTTTPSDSYTKYWVSGVARSGTFVKNSAATWNVTGSSGVPSGWTVQTASE